MPLPTKPLGRVTSTSSYAYAEQENVYGDDAPPATATAATAKAATATTYIAPTPPPRALQNQLFVENSAAETSQPIITPEEYEYPQVDDEIAEPE